MCVVRNEEVEGWIYIRQPYQFSVSESPPKPVTKLNRVISPRSSSCSGFSLRLPGDPVSNEKFALVAMLAPDVDRLCEMGMGCDVGNGIVPSPLRSRRSGDFCGGAGFR